MSERAQTIVTWLLRLVLAGVLGYAGAMKFMDPIGFAEEVANYRLLPELSGTVAATLPVTEVSIAGLLAFLPSRSPWLRPSALAALVVMLVFTVALAQVVARGIDISCGCFGAASSSVDWWTVGRALLFAAMALAVLWSATKSSKGRIGSA